MTQLTRLDNALATGEASARPPITPAELRPKIIAYFLEHRDHEFVPIHDVERWLPEMLMQQPAGKTIFAHIAEVAAEEGVETDGSIGDIARKVMGWVGTDVEVKQKIHDLACNCPHVYNDTVLDGTYAAGVLATMP